MSHARVTVLRYVVVFVITLTTFRIAILPKAHAAVGVSFVPGTTSIEQAEQDAIGVTLQDASVETNGAQFFAVTDTQGTVKWQLVSIAGLAQFDGTSWTLENAVWVGLVLAVHNTDGSWTSALKGTTTFADLLARVPLSEFDASKRTGLLLSRQPLAPDATTYRFPWQPGTRMLYGSRGVHAGDYAWRVGAYKAVDYLSDGNTASGHAPNRLLAAASGTIDFVCNHTYNSAILIGSVMYVHLVANPTLVIGHSFMQGEYIGQLKTGAFADNCGWANQQPNWFHVHWSFPDTGAFVAGGWTITWTVSSADQNQIWHRGTESVAVGGWMLADMPKTVFLPLIIIRI